MKVEDINKAGKLRDELKELEYFLYTISGTLNEGARHSGTQHKRVIIKKKVTVKYSLMATRSFATDSHTHEIEIPKSLINIELYKVAKEREVALKGELDKLLNS